MEAIAIKYNNSIARTVLKWAGGKGQLVPQIDALLPTKIKHRSIKTYIEPFLGGGAVFFHIANTYTFERAFLFDINPELVILYNVIKNDVEELILELDILQNKYVTAIHQSEVYYGCRAEYNMFDKSINANIYSPCFIRRAALTIFLNRTCFNGLFRVNRNNHFNVPMGRYKNPTILDKENLRNVSSILQHATIIQNDFSSVLDYVDRDTFIYYDPPYRPINKTSYFTSYSVDTFDDNEQIRLKKIFSSVDNKGALQMLSNSDPTNHTDDPFFDELYAEFNIYRVSAKRCINSKSTGRNHIRELIITNY